MGNKSLRDSIIGGTVSKVAGSLILALITWLYLTNKNDSSIQSKADSAQQTIIKEVKSEIGIEDKSTAKPNVQQKILPNTNQNGKDYLVKQNSASNQSTPPTGGVNPVSRPNNSTVRKIRLFLKDQVLYYPDGTEYHGDIYPTNNNDFEISNTIPAESDPLKLFMPVENTTNGYTVYFLESNTRNSFVESARNRGLKVLPQEGMIMRGSKFISLNFYGKIIYFMSQEDQNKWKKESGLIPEEN